MNVAATLGSSPIPCSIADSGRKQRSSGKQGANEDSILADSSVLEGGSEETAQQPQVLRRRPPRIRSRSRCSVAGRRCRPEGRAAAGHFYAASPDRAAAAEPPAGRGSPVAPPPIRRPTAQPGTLSAVAARAPPAAAAVAPQALPTKPVGPPPLRHSSTSSLGAVSPPAGKEVTNTSINIPPGRRPGFGRRSTEPPERADHRRRAASSARTLDDRR